MRGLVKNKLAVALAGLLSTASLVLLPRLVAQQTETVPG